MWVKRFLRLSLQGIIVLKNVVLQLDRVYCIKPKGVFSYVLHSYLASRLQTGQLGWHVPSLNQTARYLSIWMSWTKLVRKSNLIASGWYAEMLQTLSFLNRQQHQVVSLLPSFSKWAAINVCHADDLRLFNSSEWTWYSFRQIEVCKKRY